MVVLDTSVIIDHLRQTSRHPTLLRRLIHTEGHNAVAISIIAIQELYNGLSTRQKSAEEYLLATIAALHVIPYTYEVAQRAGELARDLKRPLTFADAAIAATALLHGATLATLNVKDFSSIPGLTLRESTK